MSVALTITMPLVPRLAVKFLQVAEGGWLSLTVTLNEQEASWLTPFEAVQVTCVVPFAKVCGEVMVIAPTLQVTVGNGQASAVGGVKLTEAVHWPGSVLTVMF